MTSLCGDREPQQTELTRAPTHAHGCAEAVPFYVLRLGAAVTDVATGCGRLFVADTDGRVVHVVLEQNRKRIPLADILPFPVVATPHASPASTSTA